MYPQDTLPNKDVKFYFNLARSYKNQNKIGLALEALNKASEQAEKNEDVKSLIDSYHEFAQLYIKLDNEEKHTLLLG